MENYVEVAHTKGKKVTVKDSLGVERDSVINDRRSLFGPGTYQHVPLQQLRRRRAPAPGWQNDGSPQPSLLLGWLRRLRSEEQRQWYYGHVLTYSFNKKKNSPFEFPMRKLTFELGHDITSPSDDNLLHNKDNFFVTLRATTQDQMYQYHRQKVTFTYETDWGLRFRHPGLPAGRATAPWAISTTTG